MYFEIIYSTIFFQLIKLFTLIQVEDIKLNSLWTKIKVISLTNETKKKTCSEIIHVTLFNLEWPHEFIIFLWKFNSEDILYLTRSLHTFQIEFSICFYNIYMIPLPMCKEKLIGRNFGTNFHENSYKAKKF